MIGVVIVTHGRLAAELLAACEHVAGPQEAMHIVCVGADDDLDCRDQEVCSRIREVDQGSGVIVLTDIFGGTPSNLCMKHGSRPDVEIVGGVNLPMLVKLSTARREASLQQVAECAVTSGKKYIASASTLTCCHKLIGPSVPAIGRVIA